jgi:hypothetical protein
MGDDVVFDGIMPALELPKEGEAIEGRALSEAKRVVISARSKDVTLHMMVRTLVDFDPDVGGTGMASWCIFGTAFASSTSKSKTLRTSMRGYSSSMRPMAVVVSSCSSCMPLYSLESAMASTAKGSRKSSKGDKDSCTSEGIDVMKSKRT